MKSHNRGLYGVDNRPLSSPLGVNCLSSVFRMNPTPSDAATAILQQPVAETASQEVPREHLGDTGVSPDAPQPVLGDSDPPVSLEASASRWRSSVPVRLPETASGIRLRLAGLRGLVRKTGAFGDAGQRFGPRGYAFVLCITDRLKPRMTPRSTSSPARERD